MSRILDEMMKGAEVVLEYDEEEGIVVSAVRTMPDRIVRARGAGDIDTALDHLEEALSDPKRRGALNQRIESHGDAS